MTASYHYAYLLITP